MPPPSPTWGRRPECPETTVDHADPETLGFVRNSYLSHKNWYLWWVWAWWVWAARPRRPAQEARCRPVVEMQQEYEYVTQSKPRLERAPEPVNPQPLNLAIDTL